jgi:flavin-dependent dehydrogenase
MTTDVLVIGGGPAGSAAARMLASFGHSVLLVDRPSAVRHTLAESIPASVNRLLVELGMKNAVEAAGFHPWLGNTVWWGSEKSRVEPFPAGESGYQVERARFDAVLRDVASKAGARVISGTVRDVDEYPAKIILDCSGRAGVIARKGLRQVEASHRTVALVGVWRAKAPWPSEHKGHTLVASHADGWAWSVPTADDVRYFTVMVDPERSHLTRRAPSLDVYLAELRKVEPFVPWLDNADLTDGHWGADASLYSTAQCSGPGFLLVGDAASFIDPLSSFGVKKALASGWLAAITANTILKTPEMADEARAFYEQRERVVVESFRQQTAQFAAKTANPNQHPFWEARVREFAGSKDPASEEEDPASEEGVDPDVIAAFADLRARPEIHLQQGAQVRTAPRAAIKDNLIVMEDHVFVPAWPEGVRYLRNIDIALVMKLAPDYRDVGALYDAVFRAQPGVSLPDFLGVLSTLIARSALEHAP